MTLRRAYIDTPLGQLHFAEAGSGTPVVMLHQTPRSHDEFREVQTELAGRVRTIAMDMRGFGLSAPLPKPQTIEGMAAGVLALLDALTIPSAVLLGHHTGSAVALEVAAAAPDRVRALILSATPWIDRQRRSGGHGTRVDEAEQHADGGHLTELWRQRQPYYPANRPDLLDRFVRDALAPGLDPAEGHRACGRYAMDERIGLVRCPVLVLTPSDDPFASPAGPKVVAGLTNAERVVTATLDAAMIPAMEQCADQVAAYALEFLERL
ncbi:alpha/beta hydrolase [Luedemannella helvata]|uniref:Alpha/beta fold hydrolase n=1 Tax=Luedemannella helvata TaxID=349315 RepID=A0ABN2JVA9_9ACTN